MRAWLRRRLGVNLFDVRGITRSYRASYDWLYPWGVYHYWMPFEYSPVHRAQYRVWHVVVWVAMRVPSRIAPSDGAFAKLWARRNAAYTGYPLAEHLDDWREGR